MKQHSTLKFLLCGLLAVALVLSAGCTGTGNADAQPSEQKSISIGYVLWDSEIASTNVIKQVFEKAGYDVTITAVDAAPLYQAIASGDVDCTVSAWLPKTQEAYMDEFGDRLDFVGKNLEGAKIGLVVPSYVTIDSIEEMNEVEDKFSGKIVGIDAGAGVMKNTEDAIEAYGLEYDLVYSSSAGMASALKKSVDRAEWIVVTGWTPHWKFARWDLKYLDDPKGVFGGEEYIGTLARTGLAEDDPEAYGILKRFSWTPEDMESVMLDIEDGMSHEDAAKKWIDAHPEQVDAWLGRA
ncbi:glycine betaine ABC transporter substrate-binding protein [Methanofollis formosanus]|uniref:Glycine betaine ABC transporter substrate-binding protein n=1 Tax=Methanofollis formosanus TaxID=299308 RepID=A0A8G1A051_9EURY|nr:glycine betaine ABC transporter substrate-binding protein [Methanofollis formosanus]QYZ78009.1 glycine betaine ABC transporter substrate-binding protein [Methanofollis formosanus]